MYLCMYVYMSTNWNQLRVEKLNSQWLHYKQKQQHKAQQKFCTTVALPNCDYVIMLKGKLPVTN